MYYTLGAHAVLPTSKILCRCTVSSHAKAGQAVPPSKTRSRGWVLPHPGKEPTRFYCRLAIEPRKGIYYGFDWEAHRSSALALPIEHQVSGTHWNVATQVPSKSQKRPARTKRRKIKQTHEQDAQPQTESDASSEYRDLTPSDDEDTADEVHSMTDGGRSETDVQSVATDDAPKTPRKRKRATAIGTSTPRRPRTTKLAAPTPHSKAAMRARARSRKLAPVRLPPPDLQTQEHYQQLENLPEDPWLRAMHVLHVAARPNHLPCRGEEFNKVLRTVEELLEEGSGGCVCEFPSPSSRVHFDTFLGVRAL